MTSLPIQPAGPRSRGGRVLLTLGSILTLATVVFVVVMLTGALPAWAWAFLSIAPWGPVMLFFGVLVSRRDALLANGTPGRGTVRTIRSTGSVVNGRPVLKLELAVPAGVAVTRTAPPAHLVGVLRPGVELPVRIDPAKPTHVAVDWPEVERTL